LTYAPNSCILAVLYRFTPEPLLPASLLTPFINLKSKTMKKLTLILFILIFCQVTSSSQNYVPCLPTGITFNTQNQIDSFQINHPGCTEIIGSVMIDGDDITNLNGLSVLTAIGGNLLIDNNTALTTLTGLDNITSIGWGLSISYNDALPSLTGLDNITSIGVGVGAGIGIMGNAALWTLTGLDNVTSIGGGFAIGDNPVLTSLSGLDNLTSIPGLLYIWHCSSLTSLTDLANVTSIGGDLSIIDNDVLTSLMGLDNIDAASIDSLHIYNNNSLSTCEVKSICDYLATPGGIIEINDNATGCNSQQEVEDACEAIGLPDIDFKSEFSIYPNPAKDILTISCDHGLQIDEIIIYNQIGEKVLHHKPVTQSIDVSMLRQGMYIIEVASGNKRMRGKFIK